MRNGAGHDNSRCMMNGINLSFTGAAIKKIRQLRDQIKTQFGKETIPALVWVDSTLNAGIVDSQPAFGFYDNRADIKDEDMFIVDGLEIALAVAAEDMGRFVGKTLDYEKDRFALRERSSPAGDEADLGRIGSE